MATPTVVNFNNGNLRQNNATTTLSTSVSLTFDDHYATDTLRYSFTSVSTGNLGNLVLQASNDSGNGNIGYVTYRYEVPNAAVQYLGVDQTRTETFRVTATSTSTNLINNGDFSARQDSPNVIPSWVLTNGQGSSGAAQSIAVQTNETGGDPALVFGANDTGGGSISQNFSGVSGTDYRLTFDFGTFGANEPQEIGVFVRDPGGNIFLTEVRFRDSTGSQC